MAPGEIQHSSDSGFMGRQGNLMFIYAKGEATPEVLAEAFALHREMSARYHQGYVYMLVTRADAPMPSRDARDAFERMDREFGPNLLGSAMVIEGDGLLASTMRLVMRSMSLAFSRAYPMKYFADPCEALDWLEEQCGSEKHFRKAQVLELMGRVSPAQVKVA